MRVDGRKPDQMRPVNITIGYQQTAEGSALIEVGNTRVLCAATVESTVPQWLRGAGKGWVTAEYSMLPRSTITRSAREATRGRQSGRTLEIQRLIGRALRSIVDMNQLGERTVILDCDVIQADGGTRTAAITGAYVAMVAALKPYHKAGEIRQWPVRDFVAATSIGVVGGRMLLDLCYEEDSSADVDMNLVMTGSGRFVELQATAEKVAFDDPQLAGLLALGRAGIVNLIETQKAVVSRL